jgi:hypothetical protein
MASFTPSKCGVAKMKFVREKKSRAFGATTRSGYRSRPVADDRKERALNDLVLSAASVAIIALYVVMAVALFRWSNYSSVFPPDGAPGVPIAESMIWSQ